MSTNSERHHVQLFVESEIGCTSPDKLAGLKDAFKKYTVGYSQKTKLESLSDLDSMAYYKKALKTLFQSLHGLDNNFETWSMIKLYYSIFYFQRSLLFKKRICFLRCRSIFTLNVEIGANPIERNGDAYRGDHKATITIYSKEFENDDVILTQSIEEINPFLWISGKREWVNYKRRDFIDGEGMIGLSSAEIPYSQQVESSLKDQIPILCFDVDHAPLALPVKFAQNCIDKLDVSRKLLSETLADLDKSIFKSASTQAFLNSI